MELEKLKTEKEKLVDTLKKLHDFSASGTVQNKKDSEIVLESLRQACRKAAGSEQKKAALTVEAFDWDALAGRPRRVIKEILVQLVRNAVYHGIETPEERRTLGKNETGNISLSLIKENDCACLVFKDDGRGLDFDRIAEVAEARGLLRNSGAGKTNRQFLSGLIFTPGFSTSETENLNAGRGIGLNLIRDRIKELHGSVQLKGKKGKGLTFDIKIPLKDS
jgi:two-component system chemotaxis sensor kinase CheA